MGNQTQYNSRASSANFKIKLTSSKTDTSGVSKKKLLNVKECLRERSEHMVEEDSPRGA